MATLARDGMADAAPPPDRIQRGRHSVVTRVCHWLNVVTIVLLVMSGLQIFNAHPSLYWGQYGADADRSWLQIGSSGGEGYLRIGELSVTTTGLLGQRESSVAATTAFPPWATIPSWRDLATGRRWHFFFAWLFILNGLVYLIAHTITGHMRRDIIPKPAELAPANVWHDVKEHARLNFPKGEAARRYHVLQKLAYGGTLLVILPMLVLSGLSMSPGINAAWDFLPDLFGGRAGARSMHFIAMWLLLGFIFVHVLMVVLAGPINQIRSMITGRFDLGEEPRA